jgi:hypothetical protein
VRGGIGKEEGEGRKLPPLTTEPPHSGGGRAGREGIWGRCRVIMIRCSDKMGGDNDL